MKVTIYVNWNEQKVMTEDEYNKELDLHAEEYCEDNDNFAEWLEANYTAIEMFSMEGKQKEEVRKAFLEYARDQEESGGFGWCCEDFTFEI